MSQVIGDALVGVVEDEATDVLISVTSRHEIRWEHGKRYVGTSFS